MSLEDLTEQDTRRARDKSDKKRRLFFPLAQAFPKNDIHRTIRKDQQKVLRLLSDAMTTKIAMSHKERKKRVVATFKKLRKGLESRDLLDAAFKQIPFFKALHARGVTLQPISKEIVRRYEL